MRLKAPLHMLSSARTKGNEYPNLTHHKQGGTMAKMIFIRWEEGGQLHSSKLHLDPSLNFRLVGSIFIMIVSLLLSLDAQENAISTMFPSEYGHYSLEFEF